MTVEGGIGQSIKRKEDARFIRGQGNYVDDVELPGMLYLDIVRSPYAHAKITSIDTTEALKVPGVLAVITGKDLEAAGLAWIPTLMSDQQMVLPVDRVVHQSQEVVAIVAESRYAARDGVAAVDVDYEPLPVLVDPRKALEPDAPILRPDREEQSNKIWHWEVGDKEATEKSLKEADTVVQEDIYLPRLNVSSMETC
ncbi:MAG: xanthine dehydrogenase family protein molybdopterin-binding subunit, partial [Thermoplasmata archaeon]